MDGVDLPVEGRALSRLRADVGMVFQSFNLFGHRTVLDNVTLGPLKARGRPRAEAERRARELLERVGVADQAGKPPAQLLNQGKTLAQYTQALVQTYLVVAVIYVILNGLLSRLAAVLEQRQRRQGTAPVDTQDVVPAAVT